MRTSRHLRRPLSLLLAVAVSTLGLLAAGSATARPAFADTCTGQCANYVLYSNSAPSPGNLSAGDTVTVSITSKSQTTGAVAIPAGDQLALYYTTSKGHQCTTQPNSACTLAGTGDINMPTASISFTIPSSATYIWWDAWAVVGATNLSSTGDFEYCAAAAGAILGSAGGGTVTLTANGSTTSGTLTVASGTAVTLVGSMFVSSGSYPGALYVCDTTTGAYEEATSNATSTPAATVSESSGSQTYVAFASTVGGDQGSGVCPNTNGVPIGWANSGESSEITVSWSSGGGGGGGGGGSGTPTSTTVTASPSSTTPGSTVTLTSTTLVSSNGTAVPYGGGTEFTDQSGTLLCNQISTNSSGQATCSTSLLPTGSDTVTATYSGGNGYASSWGTTTVQVEQAPSCPPGEVGTPPNCTTNTSTVTWGLEACSNVTGQCAQAGSLASSTSTPDITVPGGTTVTVTAVLSFAPLELSIYKQDAALQFEYMTTCGGSTCTGTSPTYDGTARAFSMGWCTEYNLSSCLTGGFVSVTWTAVPLADCSVYQPQGPQDQGFPNSPFDTYPCTLYVGQSPDVWMAYPGDPYEAFAQAVPSGQLGIAPTSNPTDQVYSCLPHQLYSGPITGYYCTSNSTITSDVPTTTSYIAEVFTPTGIIATGPAFTLTWVQGPQATCAVAPGQGPAAQTGATNCTLYVGQSPTVTLSALGVVGNTSGFVGLAKSSDLYALPPTRCAQGASSCSVPGPSSAIPATTSYVTELVVYSYLEASFLPVALGSTITFTWVAKTTSGAPNYPT